MSPSVSSIVTERSTTRFEAPGPRGVSVGIVFVVNGLLKGAITLLPQGWRLQT
jgi:hypothetical protein